MHLQSSFNLRFTKFVIGFRDARERKQRPIELSSRVRPLIASVEYDSEFRQGTPSIQSSRASCELRDGFRCRNEITGRGPFEGGETRIYALRMAARVDEGMHFQVIIIAVTKEGEGRRGPRLRPRPSIAGAEVIYRHCPADRYRASGELSPNPNNRGTLPFFYILISVIGNWHERLTSS